MGAVRRPITHLWVIACAAACLWSSACGSSESGVNDKTASTSPSSSTGGAASSTTNSSTAETGATSTDAGGTLSNATSAASVGGSVGSGTSLGSGGSTGSGGSAAGGTTAVGGSGGSSGDGGSGGSSGDGGSGGSVATSGGSGGSGGTPSDCGPISFGGPREDGPEPIRQTCAQIDDEVIIARYDDADSKVPRGLYYEPPGSVSWWEEPCSESLGDTVDRAGDRALGDLQTQVGTDWSYTVVGCSDGDHRFYNNLRCDYFDGETLDGSTSEDLAFLASLLWWMERGNLTGAQILGYTESLGGATDTVVMCTLRTSFGDFGLCDQITLEQTQYSITVSGNVNLGETETIRTIEGDCN